MSVLRSGETVIASETDVRSGSIGYGGVNDAFDLYLVKLASGNYILIVFMKIQFFFDDGEGGEWSSSEESLFVSRWNLAIQSRWGGRVLKYLESGKAIGIDFRFETQIGGWMFDHWEITVEKVSKFAVSSVNPVKGTVALDSQDLKLVRKSGGQRQRGAVHEFGHMLGLEDEYHKSSKYNGDYRSVMNSGETVLKRHDSTHMKWLKSKLADHGIS
ncbi:hypothetical protein [uncultured Microbulbifer sp.]|uniref:hypothetical protein n=1 Tax=uncultured Microbulbifer sp. TaxID=348147 RepID=UPI00262116F6|nr:hypothetical protein [uncultured Microbulbifer sp.]